MGWNPVTITTTWQHYPVAQQIADAIDDRIDIMAPAADTTYGFLRAYKIGDVTGWTVAAFVIAAQTAIDTAFKDRFLNPDVSLSSYIGGASAPATLSLSQIANLAGLTETGVYRRIREGNPPPTDWEDYEDVAYEYGNFQPKDMAGPWLFKDLQLLLSKYTRWGTVFTRYVDDGSYFSLTSLTVTSEDEQDVAFPTTATVTVNDAANIAAARVYVFRRVEETTPTPGDTYIYRVSAECSGGVMWFSLPTTQRNAYLLHAQASVVATEGNGPSAITAVADSAQLVNGKTVELVASLDDASGVELTVPRLDTMSYISGTSLSLESYAANFNTDDQAKALTPPDSLRYEVNLVNPGIIIDMKLDDQS